MIDINNICNFSSERDMDFKINLARTAQVWMDEYVELFYLYFPEMRYNPAVGDITHRTVLREKLKCKNFDWYLKTIVSTKFIPTEGVIELGQ